MLFCTTTFASVIKILHEVGFWMFTISFFLATIVFFVVFCIAAGIAARSTSGSISDAEAVAASSPTDSSSD